MQAGKFEINDISDIERLWSKNMERYSRFYKSLRPVSLRFVHDSKFDREAGFNRQAHGSRSIGLYGSETLCQYLHGG